MGGRRLQYVCALTIAGCLGGVTSNCARAQPVDEIIVRADPLRLIDLEDTSTIYGFDKSYLESPRASSVVSSATIERYKFDTVDDLVATTPGVFTGSFFGVPGSVNLRGSRSDTFFRGFKRVENPGTFPTPIGASERIEIVRGPTPPAYGPGRVGGFLNVIPLTAKTSRAVAPGEPYAAAEATFGSYGKRLGEADFGAQWSAGPRDFGIFLHGEFEDSRSFYRGIEPRRALGQIAITADIDSQTHIEIGGMGFHSDNYLQTIGWNRATQSLIDDGIYITGQDTDLNDTNGDGKLTPDEVDAAVGSFFGTSNIRQFIDFGIFPNAVFELDDGVGRATLDRRTVFISDRDIARANTYTAYADIIRELANGDELKLQAFFDSLNADLYVSYGFAAHYEAEVYEARASYSFSRKLGPVSFEVIAGASYRYYDNLTRQTFLSGYIAADRRDLSGGPTGSDIFDDPFSVEPSGVGWDTDLESRWSSAALFLTGDIAATNKLNILVGLRGDRLAASATNTGNTIFDPALGFTRFESADFKVSYEAGAIYELGGGLSPYITYSKNNALETNDAGGVEVDRIDQENFISDSTLFEAGVKLAATGLTGTISFYGQNRTRSDPFGNLDEENSRGVETELKYLISDYFSLTAAATFQKTEIGPPGACGSGAGEFVVLPPSRVGIAPAAGYGGLFAALNASCLPELQNGYERRTTPRAVLSAFLTYTSTRTTIGAFGATIGATYVSETGGKIDQAIRLPDYALTKAAMFYQNGRFTLSATIDNLLDTNYFIPVQNVYEEVGVLPGRGREFAISLRAEF